MRNNTYLATKILETDNIQLAQWETATKGYHHNSAQYQQVEYEPLRFRSQFFEAKGCYDVGDG